MNDDTVQRQLNKSAQKFQLKKFKPKKLLEEVIDTMSLVGGMTGLRVASHQTMTLRNHDNSYNLPIRYEQHSEKLSSFGKKAYAFLEDLHSYLIDQGVSPRKIEYHLGKAYASKHHNSL